MYILKSIRGLILQSDFLYLSSCARNLTTIRQNTEWVFVCDIKVHMSTIGMLRM